MTTSRRLDDERWTTHTEHVYISFFLDQLNENIDADIFLRLSLLFSVKINSLTITTYEGGLRKLPITMLIYYI